MRKIGVVLLLVAGGLAWLSFGDRRSPLALEVVTWDLRVGVPLAAIVGGVAVLLVVLGSLRRAPAAPEVAATRVDRPQDRPLVGQASDGAVVGDWRAAVDARAAAVLFEDGASLGRGPSAAVPYELSLARGTPPERARRSLDAFAAFLGGIPTPPRVRITFADPPSGGAPRHHLVAGVLARYFDRSAFRVTSSELTVDVQFHQPDPRWT